MGVGGEEWGDVGGPCMQSSAAVSCYHAILQASAEVAGLCRLATSLREGSPPLLACAQLHSSNLVTESHDRKGERGVWYTCSRLLFLSKAQLVHLREVEYTSVLGPD